MDRAQRIAFLRLEARALVAGKRRQLTAGEWLYLYDELRDSLVGEDAAFFWDKAVEIRRMYPPEPFAIAV